MLRLHDIRLVGEPHVLHHLTQRIFVISPYRANVVGGMTGMDSRSRIGQLGDRPARLDACDGSGRVDADVISPFLIGLHSVRTHVRQERRKVTRRPVGQGAV